MSNGIVLNHLSLPFNCKKDADNGLLAFFNVLKVCRSVGLKILLVDEIQDKSLMRVELSDGYFVQNWLVSADKNPKLKDWCRFLKSIETKQPLFETIEFENVDEKFEVGLPGKESGELVLLAAFYFETFLASFTALPTWSNSHIDVWVLELDATLQQRDEIIFNLNDESSLKAHEKELQQRRNAIISNANNIWLQRAELFPHLKLLANQIGSTLQNWSARHDILFKARDALNVLEKFSSQWSAGKYGEYRHEYLRELGLAAEVSGESKSVHDNPKKMKERLFWLETGEEVYCENHVKLPNGYRMHFYPDPVERCIHVAYLGPHLTL